MLQYEDVLSEDLDIDKAENAVKIIELSEKLPNENLRFLPGTPLEFKDETIEHVKILFYEISPKG